MRFSIIAVGRFGQGPERQLYERYAARLSPPPVLHEVTAAQGASVAQRRRREAEALEALVPARAKRIALDERGHDLDSETFAARIGAWRDDGAAEIAVLIGGADGFDAGVRTRADLVLRFGALTWPHLVVRALAAEQLYRVSTILAGHPYHRG